MCLDKKKIVPVTTVYIFANKAKTLRYNHLKRHNIRQNGGK